METPPTYRRTGPLRTGQIVDPRADLAEVEKLIRTAPPDYPGLPLLRRRRDELEAQPWIDKAAKHDLTLTREDFVWIDGSPTIDGMDPAEWIDAMTMD